MVSRGLFPRARLPLARLSVPRLAESARIPPLRRNISTTPCTRFAPCLPLAQSPPQPPSKTSILNQHYATDDYFNLPPSLVSRLASSPVLPYQESHPLCHLREQIESHLTQCTPIKAPSPVVTTDINFGMLGFPEDHPGRSPTDTYYINRQTCLRTHTSAHEVPTFSAGHTRWVLTADVYRRDEIDSSHYPIFHQMEGASIWSVSKGDFDENGRVQRECEEMEAKLKAAEIVIEDDVSIDDAGGWQAVHQDDSVRERAAELSLRHLKATLNGLTLHLFGERHAADVAAAGESSSEPLRVRWISATFPFTTPSFEVEVWFRGKWLEILGCGIVMQKTMDNSGLGKDMIGHAFGLGLERIAMILYSIPDIRLFWSRDERFLSQFAAQTLGEAAGVQSDAGGNVSKRRRLITFKPFSKYPSCYKDVSFWIPTDSPFHENDLMEIVREQAGDLAEDVKLIDSFTHPKTGRKSACYRINYRSMERSLENEEVNALHATVTGELVKLLRIEIR